jgi:hypothetical protein
MNLIKGTMEKLEGRVAVYSRFIPNPNGDCKDCNPIFSNRVLAMYGSESITEISDILGTPKEFLNKMMSDDDQLKDLLGSSKEGRNIYVSPIVATVEDHVKSYSGDIILSGSFSCPIKCIKANMMNMELYEMHYDEQVSRSTGINVQHAKEHKGTRVLYDRKIPSLELRNILMNEYIIPLLDASTSGEKAYFDDVRSGLILFSQGSDFKPDVRALCEWIELAKKNMNPKVVECYIDKMVAIHTEEYLVAKQKDDAIKALLKV